MRNYERKLRNTDEYGTTRNEEEEVVGGKDGKGKEEGDGR